jgi:outer membrane protein OmpA-like peptidoglycan-associated protein
MNSEDHLNPSEDSIMYKTISSIAVFALLVAPAAHAASSAREENIGVGSGAIIGAIAGGPVGFIVGAALGARLGDTMHKKNTSLKTMSASLDDAREDLHNLNTDYAALSAEIEHLQRVARPELVSMLQAGINMDLLFRTGEHALADTTGDRLASLAATLATMNDIKVRLDGFADERGDEAYNYNLSAQRVEFVRNQLVAAGVHPSRIQFAAHGEAPAQDASADSYALERRVSLTLFIDGAQSVAQLPN